MKRRPTLLKTICPDLLRELTVRPLVGSVVRIGAQVVPRYCIGKQAGRKGKAGWEGHYPPCPRTAPAVDEYLEITFKVVFFQN